MDYLPAKNATKVDWRISDQSRAIVEYYSRHSGYTEEDIVDYTLKFLLGDPAFAKFLQSQRRTKRMVDRIFYGDDNMSLLSKYLNVSIEDLGEVVGVIGNADTKENIVDEKATTFD